MIAHKTERNKEAFDLITEESIITLPDGNKFRVKTREKNTVDKTVRLEVTALHTIYDNVSNYQYDIIKGEKVLSLHQALTHAFEGTNITFYIEDEFDNHSFENFGDDNSIALFNKIKESFELEFKIENNTHLRIYKRLGKVTDTQLRYKHNIKTIKLEDNTHNLSTYIKGYGKPQEDEEGNVIEGKYVVATDYTSPNADKYGILHATPYYNEKITHKETLLRYLKARLIDEPEMTLTVEHQQLINNLSKQLDEIELGDTLYLIHEPMDIQFNIRINEVIDFPLHPQIKPIYTLSTNPISLIDNNTLPHVSKNNNDKEISIIKNKQTAAEKRIEKTIEAVADVENAMIDVDKELERMENEVIPAVEQAVDSAKIPTSTEPPYPIPNSKLWNDTSVNPPRLMRWNGNEWVVLAPTEDEVDALIEQMKQEAIQEGKTYTDEEINATRNAIKNKINDEIEAIEENYVDKQTYNNKIGQLDVSINDITGRVESTEVDFNDFKTGDYNLFKQQYGEFKLEMDNFTTKVGELSDIDGTLVDSFSEVKQEVGLIESTVRDVRVDLDGLEIGGRNLLGNSKKPRLSSNNTSTYPLKITEFDDFIRYEPQDGSFLSTYSNLNNTQHPIYNKDWLGKDMVASLTIRVSKDVKLRIRFADWGRTGGVDINSGYYDIKAEDGWTQVTVPLPKNRINKNPDNDAIRFLVYTADNGNANYTPYDGAIDIKDWFIGFGNKATDWSPAPEDMDALVSQAQATANTAIANAQTANNSIADIASDSKLTPVEKKAIKKEWDIIASERATVIAQANKYSIATSTYISAYNTLNSYITPLLSNLNTTSNITGTTFRARFKSYYDARTNLLKLVADKAKDLADTAQSGVNSLNTKMTAVQTTISQLPDEINLSVKQGLDGLEIGGRNLILNTFTPITLKPKNNGTSSDNYNYTQQSSTIPLLEGQEYTVSFDYEITHGSFDQITIYPRYGTNGATQTHGDTSGGKFSLTFIPTMDCNQILIYAGRSGHTRGNGMIISNLKLEKGNKATDWSPAPEDQVNKTNVLSSINLSTEGVKIQGNKIDIQGLVTVLNADGTPGTMIDGGKLINKSVTTTELNVDQIFGNSAVITKIQSDIVRTSELDAGKITSGTLDANKVSVNNLSASRLTGGTIDASKITVSNINASNISSGTLNTSNILIHGGNSTDYTMIDGSHLTARGTFKQTWKGKTNTYDIKTMLQDGYLRFRNDSEKSSLYYSWYGISTYVDGEGGDEGDRGTTSGSIYWWDKAYSKASPKTPGITVYSYGGTATLESDRHHALVKSRYSTDIESTESNITFTPFSNDTKRGFKFTKSADRLQGYLLFGDTDETGLRFTNSNDGIVQVVDVNNQTGGNTEIEAGYGRFNTIRRRAGTNYLNLQNPNYMMIGLDAAGSGRIASNVIYRRTYSSGANVHITPEDTLGRSTSASKYKNAIEKQFNSKDEQLSHSKKILNLDISTWYDKWECDIYAREIEEGCKLSDENFKLKRYVGLVAEDVRDVGLDEHVVYGSDGKEVEEIAYDRLWIHLIPVVREQQERIEEQDNRIKQLEQQMEQLLT